MDNTFIHHVEVPQPIIPQTLTLEMPKMPELDPGYFFAPYVPYFSYTFYPPNISVEDVRNRIIGALGEEYIIPPIEEDLSRVRETVISSLAYTYWESEGKPEGREQNHWFRAEWDFENAVNSWE